MVPAACGRRVGRVLRTDPQALTADPVAWQRVPTGGQRAVPLPSARMNKSQLVDALADRLGDRKTAATAVDALLQIVVDTVRSGDSVSLAGFGVFESRARAARTGRNPRTGETVAVPATTVPAFRPGTGFRSAVAGDDGRDAPRPPRPPRLPTPRPAPPPVVDVRSTTNGSGDGAALNGAVDLSVGAHHDAARRPARARSTTSRPGEEGCSQKGQPRRRPPRRHRRREAAKSAAKSDAKKGKKSKKGK